jgi:hypothetical protein
VPVQGLLVAMVVYVSLAADLTFYVIVHDAFEVLCHDKLWAGPLFYLTVVEPTLMSWMMQT